MSQYDYIIVGAGSSGCVLADRLSKDGKSTVLLLEEGSDNESWRITMPRAFMMMFGDPTFFWTIPVKDQPGRPPNETWVAGRGLGGSSSTNGTWYMRGEPADYDQWHEMGLVEWSWSEVERCYRELEAYSASDSYAERGQIGPLQISQLPFRSRFYEAAIAAAEQIGIPFLGDINKPGRQGIGYSQASVDKKGRRASTYRMFLKSAMTRSNLAVRTGALVERVEFEEGRASGVRYRIKGRLEQASARREVILSAGALQSPKLLQLSGIGPLDVLRAAGVPVMLDSPSVGRNLADHIAVSLSFRMKGYNGVNREFTGWRLLRHLFQYHLFGSGLMAYTCPELTAMIAMGVDERHPNVQIGVGPFSMRSSAEIKADPGQGALETEPGYTLNAYYLRPKGRGSVAIRSPDIDDPVVVDANWLSDPDDRRNLIQMVRLMRSYAAQTALRKFTVREVIPGSGVEADEEIAAALEWLASPGLHSTGTCRMGVTPDSVLDSRLRVRGIEGLRVVDCSAMPTPPSGNTNAPAMMLGYRAAELILEDRDRPVMFGVGA